ncbi:3-oxoacyl-[acyl-carrier-protein] synthase III C-terminal domain-containing protein, partial [Actinosynnema sp. NPDC023658]|uniref:3-oxoacyl-[acyl-carrier-protein] synthase III C-terminal domain-containing protein n=1 Tax=Actinosynnema sp. NPDC023658 TaxID=3155465 RepID=UPI0033ED3CC6
GTQVLRRLSGHFVRVAEQALADAGVEKQHLDAFIPHQSCDGITDALVAGLALPAHVAVARGVGHAGTGAGTSVPLAMRHLLDSGGVTPGGSALLLGFTAGMTCATQVVRLPVGQPVARPTTRLHVLRCARDVIGELAPTAPVGLDTSFTTDLGADALFVAEVVTEMESRLGCRIPDDVLREVRTVRDLVDHLAPERTA